MLDFLQRPSLFAAIGLRQCAHQELADFLRPAAATDDLPVEKADAAIGEHVGIADVRIAVQQRHRPATQRADIARPERDDLVAAALHDGHRQLTGAAFEAGRNASLPSDRRSEEHTSELQSLMRTSYAVFCFNNKINAI